ncbi:patatin-like phospholipase family protein [Novosphingobium sp. B 225]|uniref:patatin-like phospholipase family protein n=1 Tax=Novosphingobium sp. B 225 TaxID=1961849 RepID=UPI00159586F0|nr:patatin-like phospholipase family protein [Novosphingobium sp. B 225]
MQLSIAYQGGGARVIELLAAAKAVIDAQSAGRLKVFRVCGASAGAVAAAMHATDCDIQAVIANSHTLKSDIENFFPASRMKSFRAIPRLLAGKSLYDERHVREILIKLFLLGGIDAERPIKDIKLSVPQLRIMRSDIRYNNSSVATEASESKLVDAILDSAAIPFAFRVPKSNPNPEILDGGLFQNLPAAAAMEDLKLGQVALGFSFPKEDSQDLKKATPLEYGKAILGSLLDERMADARLRLKPSNVIEIPNRRSTFEFSDALSEGMHAQFSEDVSEIARRLENWVRTAEMMDGPDWHSDHPADLAEQAARTQIDVSNFYEDVGNLGYHADSICHEVNYRSFNRGLPDIYTLTVEICGNKNEGLQFLRFFFYDSESGAIKKTNLEIFDGQGALRKTMALPLRIPGKRIRGTLVCLDRPLKADERIKIVKTEESFDGMLEYETKGCCSQTVGLSPGRTSDKLTVIVHFPDTHKPLHYGDASLERPKDAEMLSDESGLQLMTRTVMHANKRAGSKTVVSEATLTDQTEKRRFVKVVYYRT